MYWPLFPSDMLGLTGGKPVVSNTCYYDCGLPKNGLWYDRALQG